MYVCRARLSERNYLVYCETISEQLAIWMFLMDGVLTPAESNTAQHTHTATYCGKTQNTRTIDSRAYSKTASHDCIQIMH